MKRITLLVKPTEECNFRCQYCYHADSNYVKGRMSISLFEEIIRKTASCYDEINLTFHGGEPLLMGYDFYEKAFSVIDKYKSDNVRWKLSIQTNGYLLDETFCDLFGKYGFSPSISFDGPGELNCLRAKTEEVTEKIIQLRQRGYKISLLGVITQKNVRHLGEYYAFAKETGCHCKFNPIFESGEAKGQNSIMITSQEFVDALKGLFPKYIKDENSILVEPFASLLYMSLLNKHAPICEHCGCLYKWLAVDHDGSIYPCSRSYPKEFYLGNVQMMTDISMAFKHENFRKLIEGSIERRNLCQQTCEYYTLCQGGCNNDSILNGELSRPAEFKCRVLKSLIPFIKECMRENKDSIKNRYVLDILRRAQNG